MRDVLTVKPAVIGDRPFCCSKRRAHLMERDRIEMKIV
jgi:hypothetical protein